MFTIVHNTLQPTVYILKVLEGGVASYRKDSCIKVSRTAFFFVISVGRQNIILRVYQIKDKITFRTKGVWICMQK